jgi:hypothetical protein
MRELPNVLHNQCRTVLLQCSEFDGDASLLAVFVTAELRPFQHGLPETASKKDRVDQCLDFLLPKRLSDGRPVLPLFLMALRNKYEPGDALRGELDTLAKATQKALSQVEQAESPIGHRHDAKSPSVLWPPNIPDEHYYPLPGRERHLDQLLKVLQEPQGLPVVVIDGLGGLGKTALAVELARRALREGLFEGVVGDSAKQELFTGGEIVQVREATLDLDSLLDAIARQLGRWEIPTLKAEEKQAALTHLLRQRRYLILVDNLETAENASVLVARLRGFLGECRAIVTSREQVRHDFVRPLSLQGLESEDALLFLRTDAEQHGVQQILNAPEEDLVEIHEISGGAPLALKLVVAQARFLDLSLVLKRLRQAGTNLYPFIFRQSWEQLAQTAQRVLIYIGRTVVTTASWEELSSVDIVDDEEELIEAIDQLVAYSLLDVSSAADQIRYGVHQLTRQFVTSDLPSMWREQGLL